MTIIKLKGQVSADGQLTLNLPADLANQTVEVTVEVQTDDIPRDALGWPIGFFERTYGALADDPIERPERLSKTNDSCDFDTHGQ